jgi:hypothetical protein
VRVTGTRVLLSLEDGRFDHRTDAIRPNFSLRGNGGTNVHVVTAAAVTAAAVTAAAVTAAAVTAAARRAVIVGA